MSGIKEIIKQYTALDDEVKELNKQIKPLREQRTSLGEQIITYMNENSKDPNAVLTIGGDMFKVISSKRKKINRDILESTIKENVNVNLSQTILSAVIEESTDFYLKRTQK